MRFIIILHQPAGTGTCKYNKCIRNFNILLEMSHFYYVPELCCRYDHAWPDPSLLTWLLGFTSDLTGHCKLAQWLQDSWLTVVTISGPALHTCLHNAEQYPSQEEPTDLSTSLSPSAPRGGSRDTDVQREPPLMLSFLCQGDTDWIRTPLLEQRGSSTEDWVQAQLLHCASENQEQGLRWSSWAKKRKVLDRLPCR